MNGETVHGLLHTEVVELLLKVQKPVIKVKHVLYLCYKKSVDNILMSFCRVEVKLQYLQPLLKTLQSKLVQQEGIVTEAK